MTLIFHITSQDAALLAHHTGEYRAESLAREGFIHFSGRHQVLEVARRFYSGQRGLVILAVDVSRLKAELKYEAPVHPVAFRPAEMPENEDFLDGKRLSYKNGLSQVEPSLDDLFPHLYGPLNFDAVVARYPFEPDPDGDFSLPIALTTDP